MEVFLPRFTQETRRQGRHGPSNDKFKNPFEKKQYIRLVIIGLIRCIENVPEPPPSLKALSHVQAGDGSALLHCIQAARKPISTIRSSKQKTHSSYENTLKSISTLSYQHHDY